MVKTGLFEPQAWWKPTVPWDRYYRPSLTVAVYPVDTATAFVRASSQGERNAVKGT